VENYGVDDQQFLEVLNGAGAEVAGDRGLGKRIRRGALRAAGFQLRAAPGTCASPSRRARRWRCRCRWRACSATARRRDRPRKKDSDWQRWAGSAPRVVRRRPPPDHRTLEGLDLWLFSGIRGRKTYEAVHRLKGVEGALARRGRLTKTASAQAGVARESDHLSALGLRPRAHRLLHSARPPAGVSCSSLPPLRNVDMLQLLALPQRASIV